MGKLGKKARKFAKKNLQSVMKRKRKVNSMIKKKHSSSRGKGDATEDQIEAATVPSTRRYSANLKKFS
ncbi:hypothetical protein AQUCO_05700112v1 [Aquilegia coerulea]|uniref:Uncharacterized protein n=1 Tax=Aquilegia coerulea TaxID=218851 RepID=A0A2G5CFT9_AQUCA|nr:hypothetical protein AQUCO_05700112v1 [Aquilegia coerulea]